MGNDSTISSADAIASAHEQKIRASSSAMSGLAVPFQVSTTNIKAMGYATTACGQWQGLLQALGESLVASASATGEVHVDLSDADNSSAASIEEC